MSLTDSFKRALHRPKRPSLSARVQEAGRTIFDENREELLTQARQSVQEAIEGKLAPLDENSPSYADFVARRKESLTRRIMSEMLLTEIREAIGYDAEMQQLTAEHGPEALAAALNSLRSPLTFVPAPEAQSDPNPIIAAENSAKEAHDDNA